MPSLLAILGLDASGFQSKLTESTKQAQRAGESMGNSLTAPIKQALGAFAVTALVKGAIDFAARIKDLSEQYRVDTDTIQKWDQAAKRVGMTAEDIGNALNRLKKARAESVASGELKGFADFRIPMEALRDSTITTEQVLGRMMEVAAGGKITDAQDVAGMELMGKSGARLLSAFQELHNLGPVRLLAKGQVEELDQVGKSWEKMLHNAKMLAASVYMIGGRLARDMDPMTLADKLQNWWSPAKPKTAKTETAGVLPSALSGPLTEGMSTGQLMEYRRLQAELGEKILQNNLKTLTAEEKRAALNKQISQHMKASEKASEDADWLKAQQEKLKAEQLRGDLLSVRDEPRHNARATNDVNVLQRIGAYGSQRADLGETVRQILSHVAVMAQRPQATAAGHIGGF